MAALLACAEGKTFSCNSNDEVTFSGCESLQDALTSCYFDE